MLMEKKKGGTLAPPRAPVYQRERDHAQKLHHGAHPGLVWIDDAY